jgi:hypothetical protein
MFGAIVALVFLMFLGLVCIVRRERLRFEKEKEWEKKKKKYEYKDWRY